MEYPKTARSAEEFLVCTELLPAIRERYGTTFELLEIPEVLRSDRSVGEYGTVYFRDYDGQKYNGRWSEQPGEHIGGCALGTGVFSELVPLLQRPQELGVDWLLSQHPVGKSVQRSAFVIPGWLLAFQQEDHLAPCRGLTAY